MTMSDAFHMRVISLALDNAEESAKQLEYQYGRELVEDAIKRLRDELRIYEKRATKATAS